MNHYYFFKAEELMVEVPKKVYEDWDILIKPEKPYTKEIFIEGKPKNISINHDQKKDIQTIELPFDFCDGDIFTCYLRKNKLDRSLIIVYYDHKKKRFFLKNYLTNEILGTVWQFYKNHSFKLSKVHNIYSSKDGLLSFLDEYVINPKELALIYFFVSRVENIKFEDIEDSLKLILKLDIFHSFTKEEWEQLIIDIIKVLNKRKTEFFDIKTINNPALKDFLENYIYSKLSSNNRKIAVLESIIN